MVEAGLLSPADIRCLPVARNGDEQEFPAPVLAAQPLGDLEAVEPRQADVQEYHVRAEGAGRFERLQAVVGYPAPVTAGPQQHRQRLRPIHIVVDHQDAPVCSRFAARCLLVSRAIVGGLVGWRFVVVPEALTSERQAYDELAPLAGPIAYGAHAAALH